MEEKDKRKLILKMKDKVKKQIPLIEAIISAGAIMLKENIRVTNVLSLLLLAFLYVFYKKWSLFCTNFWRKRITLGVAAVLTVCVTVLGIQSMHAYSLTGLQKVGFVAVIFCGMLLLFYRILLLIYQWADTHSLLQEKPVQTEKQLHKHFAVTFLLILLCWLPFWLMYYPGVVISDSVDQMWQAVTGVYSNHHPVVQTWLIQFIFYICGLFTDNFNTHVAVYCILQAFVVAAIYAYTIKSFYEYGVKAWFCRAVTVYFALMPYNIMFGINMWKDTLFSAFMLLFIVVLWRNTRDGAEQKQLKVTISEMFLLFLSGFGICMFRNNGLYSFLLVIPVAFIIMWKQNKKICVTLLCTLCAVMFVRGPVFSMANVSAPDTIESLSIPAQQIANVLASDGVITEEQKEQLNVIVDISRIAETYDPHGSDPIKNLVREMENQAYLAEHGGEYFKLWLQLGIQNPGFYLEAYVDQTEGYFNPDIQRWQYTVGICETSLPIETTPLLPAFLCSLLYRYIGNWGWSVPVVGMLWSIGAMVWLALILAGLCIIHKKLKDFMLFVPVAALWATLMVATPVWAEFRYIYALFLCMPVYLVLAFSGKIISDTK